MPDRCLCRRQTYRLVPSHFPPIRLFEDLLDPGELEVAYQLEALTNDRLRQEAGDIALVPKEDRLVGPGSSPIMAAFTHTGVPSRFTHGRFGVYYAGLQLETALKEAMHSRARFLTATREKPQEVTLRAYHCRVSASLVDVRDRPELQRPDDYQAPQALGAELKARNEYGIWYRSVRNPGGECIAALRPTAMRPPAKQGRHYRLHWDGNRFQAVAELREISISQPLGS